MTMTEAMGIAIVVIVMVVWLSFLCWVAVLLLGPWFGAGVFAGCMFLAGLAVGAVLSNGDRR